ncbi:MULTISPECIES: ROK family transcriptional regulator [Actinomyces]|uniref:ROK family transcriptional regulator n=1 Tax=Actinomyces respiraculi TaxID=2744574 RepID=A0A7T0PV02_9ACTO|nr:MULTISPECIES: ROK family transcriptional regulator [Actinomyces]QPL04761.1 ROK family transcriptional regulator [Actinomyces respiraculi]
MEGAGRSLGARALLSLICAGPMSRAELGRRLGLSAATTTRTVRPLIEASLVEEGPPAQAGGPGRPTRLLAVVPTSATVVGIKLTDDRLYAVLTDALGQVLAGASRPLTVTDPHSVTTLIASVVTRLARRSDRRPDAIGIALGAAVVERRTVVVASFLGWRDVPLADMVGEATSLPCVVANDVRAFAYAESWYGTGHGHDPFALVTFGAGIGCGIAVGGEVVSGARGAAGSVGHLPVAPSGPSCEIGHAGCARALASTAAILRAAAEHLGCEPEELSVERLLSPQLREHPGIDEVLRRAALAAGRVVGSLIAYVDPELVVVSGEGVAVLEAYRETFEEEIAGLRHWTAAPVPVLLRPFEFDEWARGAAALALERWALVAGDR